MSHQLLRAPFAMADDENQRFFVQRLTVPLVVNLPRVLTPIAFCISGDELWEIMEFFPNGSLADASKAWQEGRPPAGFGPTELTKCIFGIAFTMSCFHSRGGIHQNLSDYGIFLDSRFETVIGSFTLAAIAPESSTLSIRGGTPLYMAPEIWDGDDYGIAVDLFAFAVLICRCFDTQSWSDVRNQNVMQRKIVGGERLPRPSRMPDGLWALVNDCWRQNPNERLTFSAIVDRLNQSPAIGFAGTDAAVYSEYRSRLLNERPPAPRPIELRNALCDLLGWDRFDIE